MSETIRVILADDHALVRQGIRQFLDGADDISVIGEASDGREALQLVERLRPDIAILDIRMPGMTGSEATRVIRADYPEVQVLILTAYNDDRYACTLLQEGASAYLLKSEDPDKLVQAVRKIYRGQPVLCSEVSNNVLRQSGKGGQPSTSQPGAATAASWCDKDLSGHGHEEAR